MRQRLRDVQDLMRQNAEIAPRALAADGMRLRERLEVGDITVMQATPATWRDWSCSPTAATTW